MGFDLIKNIKSFINETGAVVEDTVVLISSAQDTVVNAISSSVDNVRSFAKSTGTVMNEVGQTISNGFNEFGNLLVEGYDSIGDEIIKISNSDIIQTGAETIGSLIDRIDFNAFIDSCADFILDIPDNANKLWDTWIDYVSDGWNTTYWHYVLNKGYKKTTILNTENTIDKVKVDFITGNVLDILENKLKYYTQPEFNHYTMDHYLLKYKTKKCYRCINYLTIQQEYEDLIYNFVDNLNTSLDSNDIYFKKVYDEIFGNAEDGNKLSSAKVLDQKLPLVQTMNKQNLINKKYDELFLAAMNKAINVLNKKIFYNVLEKALIKSLAVELKAINKRDLSTKILDSDVPTFNKDLQELIKSINADPEAVDNIQYSNIKKLYDLLKVIVEKNSFGFFDLSNYLNDEMIIKVLKANSNGDDLLSIKCLQFYNLFLSPGEEKTLVESKLSNIETYANDFRNVMMEFYASDTGIFSHDVQADE